MDIPALFRLREATVAPAWTDYNRHLTESALYRFRTRHRALNCGLAR